MREWQGHGGGRQVGRSSGCVRTDPDVTHTDPGKASIPRAALTGTHLHPQFLTLHLAIDSVKKSIWASMLSGGGPGRNGRRGYSLYHCTAILLPIPLNPTAGKHLRGDTWYPGSHLWFTARRSAMVSDPGPGAVRSRSGGGGCCVKDSAAPAPASPVWTF